MKSFIIVSTLISSLFLISGCTLTSINTSKPEPQNDTSVIHDLELPQPNKITNESDVLSQAFTALDNRDFYRAQNLFCHLAEENYSYKYLNSTCEDLTFISDVLKIRDHIITTDDTNHNYNQELQNIFIKTKKPYFSNKWRPLIENNSNNYKWMNEVDEQYKNRLNQNRIYSHIVDSKFTIKEAILFTSKTFVPLYKQYYSSIFAKPYTDYDNLLAFTRKENRKLFGDQYDQCVNKYKLYILQSQDLIDTTILNKNNDSWISISKVHEKFQDTADQIHDKCIDIQSGHGFATQFKISKKYLKEKREREKIARQNKLKKEAEIAKEKQAKEEEHARSEFDSSEELLIKALNKANNL